MRTFRICGRSLDGGSCGADRLLEFLFSRCQWIVRDVQRVILYFGFDHAVHRFDCISYLLLVSGISELIDFNASGHGFAQTRIGLFTFLLHVLNMFVCGAMISCIRIQLSAQIDLSTQESKLEDLR